MEPRGPGPWQQHALAATSAAGEEHRMPIFDDVSHSLLLSTQQVRGAPVGLDQRLVRMDAWEAPRLQDQVLVVRRPRRRYP